MFRWLVLSILFVRLAADTGGYGIISWGGDYAQSQQISFPSDLTEGVESVIAGRFAFAAITTGGKVRAWGDRWWGGDVNVPDSSAASNLSKVKKIFSTSRAFAALTSDSDVVTWGDPLAGGQGPQSLGNVRDIVGNEYEFAAIKHTGEVVSWGNSPQAAYDKTSFSSIAVNVNAGVEKIVTTSYAFAALKSGCGEVFTWGANAYGGDSTSVSSVSLCDIWSTETAFAGITDTGKVVAWPPNSAGGNAPDNLMDVVKIFSTSRAFAAVLRDKTVVSWGDADAGGDSSGITFCDSNILTFCVEDISSTDYAFAALSSSGGVVTWGSHDHGGNSDAVKSELKNVKRIFSNRYAFAALLTDGKVVTWGNADFGGDSSIVSERLIADVATIFSTERAFAAIKNNGEVVTWGHFHYGGQVPQDLLPKLQPRNFNEAARPTLVHHISSNEFGRTFVALICPPTNTSCQPCDAHYYWNASLLQCAECASFEVPDEQSRTQCESCPSGSVPSPNGSKCIPCNFDEWAEGGVSVQCTRCNPDSIVNEDKTGCKKCDTGMVPASGESVCRNCEAGFVPNSLQAGCEPCATTEFSRPGFTECRACIFIGEKNEAGDGCDPRWGYVVPIVFAILLVLYFVVMACRRCQTSNSMNTDLWNFLQDKKKMKSIDDLERILDKARKVVGVSHDYLQQVESNYEIQKNRYSTFDALQSILGEGDLKLVHGNTLVKDASNRLKRMQDLSKDTQAFWTQQEFKQRERMIAVVAVSYCWMHKNHPDPHEVMYPVVKAAAKLRLDIKGKGSVQDLAVFVDYMSIAQHEEDVKPDPREPTIKVPRNPVEEQSFRDAMLVVNILYANQKTETWVLAEPPDLKKLKILGGFDKYQDRAWPTFELAVSSLIKDHSNLICLDSNVKYCSEFDEIKTMAVQMQRVPPVVPEDFNKIIKTKRVRNGRDISTLRSKYKETFDDVIRNGRSLWFANLGWGLDEAELLVKAFRYCHELETIILCGNKFDYLSALKLIKASRVCQTLKSMDLSNNRFGKERHDELFEAWTGLDRKKDALNLGEDIQESIEDKALEQTQSPLRQQYVSPLRRNATGLGGAFGGSPNPSNFFGQSSTRGLTSTFSQDNGSPMQSRVSSRQDSRVSPSENGGSDSGLGPRVSVGPFFSGDSDDGASPSSSLYPADAYGASEQEQQPLSLHRAITSDLVVLEVAQEDVAAQTVLPTTPQTVIPKTPQSEPLLPGETVSPWPAPPWLPAEEPERGRVRFGVATFSKDVGGGVNLAVDETFEV